MCGVIRNLYVHRHRDQLHDRSGVLKNEIMRIAKKYIDAIESLDWTFRNDGKNVELEKFSPYGEDFIMTLPTKNFIKELLDCKFDEEEHVMMWMEAKKNKVRGVPPMRTLVDDAEAITDMIEELQDKIQSMANK